MILSKKKKKTCNLYIIHIGYKIKISHYKTEQAYAVCIHYIYRYGHFFVTLAFSLNTSHIV